MTSINPQDKKYIITFKRKDLRPNQRDDKIEIFRNAIGLEDVRDVLDLSRYSGGHMTDEIHKTPVTVTDINSFETPFVIAKLNPDQANRLRKNPNIEIVEEDVMRYPMVETPGYHIGLVKANTTWVPPLGVQGEGVKVAVIDDGRLDHPDFGSNIAIEQDFTGSGTTKPDGGNFHGTLTGGFIGAVMGNDIGIQGVAPKATLWNLKAATTLGFASADTLEAYQFVNQNNAQVVNMSYGGPNNTSAEVSAVNAAMNKGIIFVGSSGNDGKELLNYPAAIPGVIGIGSINQNKQLSAFSTRGTHVDFCAPGEAVTSLARNNGYAVVSGTSLSAPCVTGIIALALSAYRDNGCPPYSPGAKKNEVIERVMRDTVDKDLAGFTGNKNIQFGYGMPLADKIVASLKGVVVTNPPPGGQPAPIGGRPNPPAGGNTPYIYQINGTERWVSDVGDCMYIWNSSNQRWEWAGSLLDPSPGNCAPSIAPT